MTEAIRAKPVPQVRRERAASRLWARINEVVPKDDRLLAGWMAAWAHVQPAMEVFDGRATIWAHEPTPRNAALLGEAADGVIEAWETAHREWVKRGRPVDAQKKSKVKRSRKKKQ